MRRRLLFVTALATSLVAGAVATANRPADAAFSGLNGKITFTRELPGGNGEIFAMNADGSDQTNLTNDPRFDYFSAGSPDGVRIAFTRVLSGDIGDIFAMNADGSDQTNLTNTSAFDVRPDWSPDGASIAFGSHPGSNWEVFVMNADGSGQTDLTNNPALDWSPTWSSDGTKIAFETDRTGNFEIFAMNADGSGQTNLTNSPVFDGDAGLVARRYENRLHADSRPDSRGLRHERRREWPDEPDQQSVDVRLSPSLVSGRHEDRLHQRHHQRPAER